MPRRLVFLVLALCSDRRMPQIPTSSARRLHQRHAARPSPFAARSSAPTPPASRSTAKTVPGFMDAMTMPYKLKDPSVA